MYLLRKDVISSNVSLEKEADYSLRRFEIGRKQSQSISNGFIINLLWMGFAFKDKNTLGDINNFFVKFKCFGEWKNSNFFILTGHIM